MQEKAEARIVEMATELKMARDQVRITLTLLARLKGQIFSTF
jgi:hypothetical protein